MLLASLIPGGVPRVGFLDCPHILPIAGHDAFSGPSRKFKGTKKGKKGKKKDAAGAQSILSVNVEVFLDAPRGITIVQIRAPVAPGRHREHAAMLAAWIKSVGFRQVVSLSTLPIHARREAQLADPEVMRAVQTSAAAADDSLVQPPLALRLEPELEADPAIWRKRSSTVLLHDEAERRGVAQTTVLRFCEVSTESHSSVGRDEMRADVGFFGHLTSVYRMCVVSGRKQYPRRHCYGPGLGKIPSHTW